MHYCPFHLIFSFPFLQRVQAYLVREDYSFLAPPSIAEAKSSQYPPTSLISYADASS